jgi:hypothetical protein
MPCRAFRAREPSGGFVDDDPIRLAGIDEDFTLEGAFADAREVRGFVARVLEIDHAARPEVDGRFGSDQPDWSYSERTFVFAHAGVQEIALSASRAASRPPMSLGRSALAASWLVGAGERTAATSQCRCCCSPTV